MVSSCILPLLTTALVALVSAEQHILAGQPSQIGNLHRFSIASSFKQVLDIAHDHNLDIWAATKSYVDVFIPGADAKLPGQLQDLAHTVKPIASPIPTPKAFRTHWNLTSLHETSFHDSYHPLFEIESFLQELQVQNPNTTRLRALGHSAEGREMYGISVSTGAYPDEENDEKKKKKKKIHSPVGQNDGKLGFVILGAQHAREWIATSTALYLTQALTSNSSEASSLSPLLKHFDFHIVPVPNPDGYDYTWEADRYWYKNRQVLGPDVQCVGLDMNRNWARFGYKWKPGSRASVQNNTGVPFKKRYDPCSHWYPGSRPFESPETNNIANWISTLPNIVSFIDLRSYGQMLSSPFSYSCKRNARDAEDQIEVAIGASHAMKAVHGTEFQIGSLCSNLYPAPGNVLDWMYTREGIKYSYVAHLRDTGTYGFSLPPTWIRPTGEESAGLVSYIARFIARQTKRPF